MKKNQKDYDVEKLLKQNKRLRLALEIIVLFLILVIIGLFYYKKNIIQSTFELNGDESVTINFGEKYEEKGFKALIYDKDAKKNVKVTSNLNTDKVGKYEIKYRLYNKYLNVDKELIRKVNVVDVIPPELTVESEDNIYLFEGEEFVKPVYHANDNYDKDITDKVKVDSNVDTNKVGDYVLKYIVKDSSDNETTKEINVHVQEKRKNAKVVVSILNQTLNYYEKGQVVLSSPVVTGLNNATPKGTYKILSKSRNVTLVGENYESHVRYWMPFIGRSYGLHDASWRSNFGGQIYKTNGSHGCVNLPTNKAAQLYDLIEVGTPVIITD